MDAKKKKTFTRDVTNTVRIGPRMSKPLYVLAKYVYSLQGVSMEERIEDLIRKDLEYAMKQKWYAEVAISAEGKDLQLLMNAFAPVAQRGQRKGKSDFESDGFSDFESNDPNGGQDV